MIKLELPWPPSVNHYYMRTRRGMIIGKRGIAYREEVKRIVRESPYADEMPMKGDVKLVAYAGPPDKRKRDIDNIFKCLLDSLTKAGVYEDDFQICDLRIVRCEVFKGGTVSVYLGGKNDELA